MLAKEQSSYSFEQERDQIAQRQGQVRQERGAPAIGWPDARVRVTLGGYDAAAAARHPIWTKTLKRMFAKEELARVQLLAREQLARMEPRLQVVSRLGVRGVIQEVQPHVIQLKAFDRDNLDHIFIHPVLPQPMPVQNRKD